MRARWWVTIIALFLFGLTAVLPPRARAISDEITKPLIISGAVAGAVAVIFLIAILVGSARETEFPEFDAVTHPGHRPDSLPWARCPQRDAGLTLLCW